MPHKCQLSQKLSDVEKNTLISLLRGGQLKFPESEARNHFPDNQIFDHHVTNEERRSSKIGVGL